MGKSITSSVPRRATVGGDTCPQFTTIAAFVSGLGDLIGTRDWGQAIYD